MSCTTCPNCLSVGLSGPPREAVEALDRQWVLVGRLVRRVAHHVPQLPVGRKGRGVLGVSMPETLLIRALRAIETRNPL